MLYVVFAENVNNVEFESEFWIWIINIDYELFFFCREERRQAGDEQRMEERRAAAEVR